MMPPRLDLISDEQYRARDGISRSVLHTLRQDPLRCYIENFSGRPTEIRDTPSFRVGRMVHLGLLEPERWGTLCPPRPDFDLRTKAGREAEKAWRIAHPDAWDGYSVSERHLAMEMTEAVEKHKLASSLVSGLPGRSEVSLFWDHGVDACKARLDRLLDSGDVVEVKTMDGIPTPERFAKAAVDHWYHGQAAFYLDGCDAVSGAAKQRQCWFVVVGKSEPHHVLVAQLDDDAIELGRREYRAALRELAWRRERNDWSFPWEAAPQRVSIPGWAFANSEAWRETR